MGRMGHIGHMRQRKQRGHMRRMGYMGRMVHRGNVYPVNALSILQIPIIKLTCNHYIVRAKHVSPLYYFAFAIIYVPASGCLIRHIIPAFMVALPSGHSCQTGGFMGRMGHIKHMGRMGQMEHYQANYALPRSNLTRTASAPDNKMSCRGD